MSLSDDVAARLSEYEAALAAAEARIHGLEEYLWTLYEGLYGHRSAPDINPFSTAVYGALSCKTKLTEQREKLRRELDEAHTARKASEARCARLAAALQWVAQQFCDRAPETAAQQRVCPDSGDCVTEWCLPCYARAALADAPTGRWVSEEAVDAIQAAEAKSRNRKNAAEMVHGIVDLFAALRAAGLLDEEPRR